MRRHTLAAAAAAAVTLAAYLGLVIAKPWCHFYVERAVPAAWLEVLPGLQPVQANGKSPDLETGEYNRNSKFLCFETGAK